MPKYNKSKDIRETARKLMTSAEKQAIACAPRPFIESSRGPSHPPRHSRRIISSAMQLGEGVHKFHLVGPNLLKSLRNWKGGDYSHSLLKWNKMAHDTRRETIKADSEGELIQMFFNEVAGEDKEALEHVIDGWEGDLNSYIKKSIRYFRDNPMYPPGTLIKWIGKGPLQTWTDDTFEELKAWLTYDGRPWSTQLIKRTNNSGFALNNQTNKTHQAQTTVIYPNTTMLVTKETIILGENEATFWWNRVLRVITTTKESEDDKDGRVFGALITYNAHLPRQNLDDCIEILKYPTTLSRNQWPAFVFPKEPYVRKRINDDHIHVSPEELKRVEEMYMSLKEKNKQIWEKEAARDKTKIKS